MKNINKITFCQHKKFLASSKLEVGDYVIMLKPGLKGQTTPRVLWEHAIVTEVFPGNDGLVQKAKLRPSGQHQLM